MDLFIEFSLIIILATTVSIIVKLFKQPIIVGYIAAGVLVGPYALNILQSQDEIEFFSKVGIAILLFIVGLTLNPDVMREVGRVSVITGLGQIIFTSIVGYFIASALGFSVLTSIYIAIALTFSSTIIILKLLSDRGDMQSLYGKISIGCLLIQDIVAAVILLGISILGSLDTTNIFSEIVLKEAGVLLGKGALAILVLYVVARYILPRLAKFVAGYQEVLFIFSLAWGLGIASLFHTLGFSIEIGALAAGVTLAVSPFAYEIASRMKPLRDLFIMIFFILLGSQIVVTQAASIIVPAVVLSLFVLVGNPIIVFILMNLLGYRSRTAFMTGLTMAQISEFSLILIALGLSVGHIDQDIASLVTLVGIITIAISTYLILYADWFYRQSKTLLNLITWRRSHIRRSKENVETPEMIIFGYDRVGHEFVKVAHKLGVKFLVVDYNPTSINRMEDSGIPSRYGDASDAELLEEIGMTEAKLVVSTIPDIHTNLLLVEHYRAHNKRGVIITLSNYIEGTKELYKKGASYVVMPHHLGARHAASLILGNRFSKEAFTKDKDAHLKSIEEQIRKYA